jgi:CRP-like cAMP-binding protein
VIYVIYVSELFRSLTYLPCAGDNTRLFTVQATEETEALRLNREEFQKVMEQFPEAVSKTTGNLLTEIAAWDRRLLEGDDWDPETIGVSLI